MDADKKTEMKCAPAANSRAKQMARFHLLVDLDLQGKVSSAEKAELVTLRMTLDRRDASATAKLLKRMTKEQQSFDKSMAGIRAQVAALKSDPAYAQNRQKSKSATAR